MLVNKTNHISYIEYGIIIFLEILCMEQFASKIKNQLYWWLKASRPFIINDEYKLELLHIDRDYESVKILITNLNSGEIQEVGVEK